MNKISFLSISGIDGTGKTTIARALAKKLDEKKHHTLIVKCGANIRFATFPLYLLCKTLGYVPKYDSNREIHSSRYPKLNKSKILASLWTLAVFIDTFLIVFLRIKIPLFFGKVVISDRFVHDVIVELIIATKNDNLHLTKFGHLFLAMAKPDLTFVIDINEEIAFNRKSDVPSINHLKVRRNLYLKLASDLKNVHISNGNKSIQEIKDEMISHIQR